MKQVPQIISANSSSPVILNGEKSIYLENKATVNFYGSFPFAGYSFTGEVLKKIQEWDCRFYQLIITGSDFMRSDIITVSAYDALTKANVPNEIYDRCSTLTPEGCEELLTYPSLICNQNTEYHGKTEAAQQVLFAALTDIQTVHSMIQIKFFPIGFFSQELLNRNHDAFGIHSDCAITDLNRYSWTVHETNIFKAFEDAGIDHLPSPYGWRNKE